MKSIRICALFFCLCFSWMHCAPSQNTCSSGNPSLCTCPDGSKGERPCLETGLLGPCYCKVFTLTEPSTPEKSSSEPTNPGEKVSETSAEPSSKEPSAPDEAGTADSPGNPEPKTEAPTEPAAQEPPSDTQDAGPSTPECPPEGCACPKGAQLCTNYCADILYDPFHCGRCKNACGTGLACLKGKCQCFFSKLIESISLGCAPVKSVHYALDGKTVAAVNDNGRSCGADLHIWDAKTRKPIHKFTGVTYRPVQVIVFKDNDTVMVRGGGRRFYRFSLKQKKGIQYIDAPAKSGTTHAVVEPVAGNALFAVGTSDPSIAIIDNNTRKSVKVINGLPDRPVRLAYRKDGKRLAAALANSEVWVYDTQTWKVVSKLQKLSAAPSALAFNDAGTSIAVALKDHKIVLWEPDSGKTLRTISFQANFAYNINEVIFSADGKQVISAWSDRTAKIHEVATGQLLHTLGEHRFDVYSLARNPAGTIFVSASGSEVKFWGCQN